MRTFLVACLLLLGAFAGAGCLDDSDGSLITAKAALPKARAEARQWQDDAALSAAIGLEISDDQREEAASELSDIEQEIKDEEEECLADAEDDEERDECREDTEAIEKAIAVMRSVVAAGHDEPGDGKASLWVFGFYSESADDSFVALVDARRVLMNSEDDEDLDFDLDEMAGGALDEWSIDSDDAAKVARESNSLFANLTSSSSANGFSILTQNEETGPIWVLGIEDDDSDEEVVVAVSATNGTVVELDAFGNIDLLIREFGFDNGQFMPLVGSAQTGFMVQQNGHRMLVVHASVSPPPVGGAILVSVTDPMGNQQDFTIAFNPTSVDTQADGSILLSPAIAGQYSVSLQAPTISTSQNWNLDWCTDGTDFGSSIFMGNIPACDEVDDNSFAASAPAGPSETISHLMRLLGL